MSRILVTGATGFVGARLCERLSKAGHDVRAGTRHPETAKGAGPNMTFCHIDLADEASVEGALEGMDAAVYLVHGMTDAKDYAKVERTYAENFVAAAAARKTGRIVYLGGPKPKGEVSHHLESRLQTGKILRGGPVPVVELQATMIVGARSESFRMVRDLAARLPAMLVPKWLESRSEPVGIDDVTSAIAHALEMALEESVVLGMPGPEVLSAKAILERTAHLIGRAPIMVDVPLVSPKLSAHWIGLVTRADSQVATELVEGLRSDLVIDGPTIWDRMPGYERVPLDEAIKRALVGEEKTLPEATLAVEDALQHLARPAT